MKIEGGGYSLFKCIIINWQFGPRNTLLNNRDFQLEAKIKSILPNLTENLYQISVWRLTGIKFVAGLAPVTRQFRADLRKFIMGVNKTLLILSLVLLRIPLRGCVSKEKQ